MSQIKVELQEWMGSDKSIAEAAWTSSTTLEGKSKRTDADIERVVKMLIEQKHASPIESVVLRFWIKMPIQSDRQHMTHRVASHNGMSGRYRTMPSEFLEIPGDIMTISQKAAYRDSFDKVSTYNYDDMSGYEKLCESANIWYNNLVKSYKDAESKGCITNQEYKRAREFFRGVLPQNNMTERVTIMNLRSFANYQKLRNSEHAQPEIREVAELMLKEVKEKKVAPIAISMLELNKWEI